MVDDARQAEVEHLHVAVGPDHDVLGLDVAMDDAGRVRGGERARDLAADVDASSASGLRAPRCIERSVRPSMSSCTMKCSPAGVSPTSWMVTMLGWLSAEAARASRRKRCDDRRLLGVRVAHHLDRDRPVQPRVERAEHLAHAAAADAPIDAVVPEAGRCHQVRWAWQRPRALYIHDCRFGAPFLAYSEQHHSEIQTGDQEIRRSGAWITRIGR